MKISYSALAKVILSGEHAVVYGKPALVSAINLRLKFSLTILGRSSQDCKINREIFFISGKVKEYLINQKINFIDKPFNFEIESEIPIGRGLGSSAALSVASTSAFLEFYSGRQFEKNIINNIAFEVEKHFHQNPSGVDNTATCFGGLILYQKNAKINNLNFKIPKNIEEKLFLIDSGKPKETTGEMVEYVSKKSVTYIINKIEVETKNIEVAIKKENINLFKNSFINNEILLEELGVVSEITKTLLKDLSQFGVGKVTGAGGRKEGSGFLLFYADDIEKLIEYLNINKIVFYKFVPDSLGLIRL
ncbi:hypothetical protein COU88_01715 [Candidatus Roizmanbacteria bacterium CG10_big_fil_rev_8_21_14_0_10_39_6]|uniref:mevalonate kinase n=1 Tax=Candidatus Roizmanbacteria bacterium CG10_big_fil_rev_8_21_14_0_10_39_6 TaxID=1974853 RepID=A0A2M8KSY2_9BACT|nr:MAG: hypothetical protein COU88_01715 [Candidatus Roizmanbacteria bacterium CG10_big_fil_rev_8_21_14_0_10_39_6]